MGEEAKTDVESGRPLMEDGKVAYVADSEAVAVSGQADKFVGLSKDELEQYRNAPFWRNLRYLLFGLFWLAWIAMFAAAIAIVVMSPPCKAKVKPHWWQMKLGYQVFTPSFADSDGDGLGDLPGISAKVSALQRLNTQTLWPRPLLQSKPGSFDLSDVTDFNSVDSRFGTNQDLTSLIDALHSRDMYFILDIPLTTSTDHDWFKRSAKKESGYEDVYKWAASAGSAEFWSSNGDRPGENYLHVEGNPNQAVLNLQSASAKDKLREAIHGWLDKGVDGIYLYNIDYLARTADGSQPDWDAAYPILSEMDAELIQYKNETGVSEKQLILFSGVDASAAEDVRASLVTEGKLSYVYYPGLSSLSWEGCGQSVGCIRDALTAAEKHPDSHPLWELGNAYTSRVSSRWDEERSSLLHMLLLTLPGAVCTYYGDEIGLTDDASASGGFQKQQSLMQWDGSANAGFSTADAVLPPGPGQDFATRNFENHGKGDTLRKVFTRLAGLRRRQQTLMNGDFHIINTKSKKDGAIITVRRPANESSGYVFVTVLNFLDNRLSGVDVTQSNYIAAKEAEVVAVTTKAAEEYTARSTASLVSVALPPTSGVVFRYQYEAPEPDAPA